jgi:hypothetical protein
MVTRGSEWRRWEPHIHAPGTVLNNQFGGPDPWEAYLQALETRTPAIEAIGVTDYFVTDSLDGESQERTTMATKSTRSTESPERLWTGRH